MTTILRTCKRCKHLIGKRDNWFDSQQWICGHPSNIVGVNLVNERNIYIIERCDDQRSNEKGLCKEEGIWFEEYVKPVYADVPIPISESFQSTDLSDLAKQAQDRVAALKAKSKKPKMDFNNL